MKDCSEQGEGMHSDTTAFYEHTNAHNLCTQRQSHVTANQYTVKSLEILSARAAEPAHCFYGKMTSQTNTLKCF